MKVQATKNASYDNVLSDGDRNKVEGYLTNKWSFSSDFTDEEKRYKEEPNIEKVKQGGFIYIGDPSFDSFDKKVDEAVEELVSVVVKAATFAGAYTWTAEILAIKIKKAMFDEEFKRAS